MTAPEWAALWRGRRRFVVLDTAFGNADRFVRTWLAWLDDPGRSDELTFIAIDPEPPTRAVFEIWQPDARRAPLADELARQWPAPTPDLHLMAFASGRIRLQLAVGTVESWLPRIEAQVDTFIVDDRVEAAGAIAAPNLRFLKRLARIAAPGAWLMLQGRPGAAADAEPFHRHLRTVGFEPLGLSGAPKPAATRQAPRGGQGNLGAARRFLESLAATSDGNRLLARFEPSFKAHPKRQRSGKAHDAVAPTHAIVVGAGLAGCAAAWALARHGVGSIVLERRSRFADDGSGNAAGLFHGVVHRDDARHARFNRAAALDAHRQVSIAIGEHAVAGHAGGLLRLETSDFANTDEMAATLERLRLPRDHVRAVSAREATDLAGVEVVHPAWYYPTGGWVDPRGLARFYLERAMALLRSRSLLDLRVDTDVGTIRRIGRRWQALDRSGIVIAAAPVLVLANAGDALRLLGSPDWPIECLRGQVSAADASALTIGSVPRLPITGSGYVLPPIDGRLWFGAASSRDDADSGVRFDDHVRNVTRLAGLLPGAATFDVAALTGRTGFRWSSRDRMPIAGAVPRFGAFSTRPEQTRWAPRIEGLFICAGLGSRGIAWSGLCAQVVAAQIAGAAAPLPADLLDAIDPARFASRAHRRAEADSAGTRRALSVP